MKQNAEKKCNHGYQTLFNVILNNIIMAIIRYYRLECMISTISVLL